MDQTNEVREVTAALTAKSTTATLDELRDKGRKKVKLIRAADIASMIEETVFRVLQDSQEAESQEAPELSQLVERSKGEFRKVLAQRQAEAKQAEVNLERLSTLSDELSKVTGQLSALQARNAELEAQVQGGAPAPAAPAAAAAPPAELPPAFQQDAAPAAGAAPGASAAAQMEGANAEMMMAMMQQLNELKASMGQGGAPAPAAPSGDAADLSAALDKINSSLNDRLEKFGRKMGISSAADAAEVDYSSLFGDEADAGLESNMENVQVKKKKGGGIAGNLARLKKLKGGG